MTKSALAEGRQGSTESEAKSLNILQKLVGSLAFKIGAAIVVTEIIVLIGIGIPLIAQHNVDLDRRAVGRILIPGTLMQEGVLSYASVANRRIMTDLLGEELINGMVVGANSNVFYSLDARHLGKDVGTLPGIDPTWFDSSNTEQQIIESRGDRETFLISITPLFTLDSKVPSLFAYIKTNTTKITEDKAAWRRLIFIGTFAVVSITSLIIFVSFQMLIFRRIVRSVNFVEQVRRGDVESRLAKPGNDEFGNLERGMNEMVANIKRRREQHADAEDALRISESRLSGILDISAEAIVSTDEAQTIVLFNQGAQHIFGYLAEEVMGKPLEMLLPTGIRAKHHGYFERFNQSPETTRSSMAGRSDIVGLRKDGTEFPATASISKLELGDQKIFTVTLRDISKRKRAEEQLLQAQKMEAIGQLTGGVAHDFNNLLTVTLGNLDMLQDHIGDNPAAQKLINTALKASERGADLTQRLLAYSRKQALDPEVTEVNRLISESIELLRRTLGEDIEIEAVLDDGLWKAMVDPKQLENAILNLALNARDAMPDGGKLTIETANIHLDQEFADTHDEVRRGRYVLIEVSDTGAGMPAEVIDQAFDPFFTTKEVGQGSGLGLSMVYGFAKQSDGHVAIYSEVNHGTTIKLYLPRVASTEEPIGDEPGRKKLMPKGNETILVVEDDAAVRDFITAALRSVGYSVIEAADGESALALVDETPDIGLLITDVILPHGMNGREVADGIRKRRPGTKVLFTSGYAKNVIVHQGKLDKDVELLSKPYTREVLARRVRGVLDAPETASRNSG